MQTQLLDMPSTGSMHHVTATAVATLVFQPTMCFFFACFSSSWQKLNLREKDVQRAVSEVDACCNPASGEVIPAPFRLSGFLLCNVPIVATMLFTKSVYVQVCQGHVHYSRVCRVGFTPHLLTDSTTTALLLSLRRSLLTRFWWDASCPAYPLV